MLAMKTITASNQEPLLHNSPIPPSKVCGMLRSADVVLMIGSTLAGT